MANDEIDLRIRSFAISEDVNRAPNRAMLRAVGFHNEDFKKPMIGIASTWSEVTPCNIHIDNLARVTKQAAREAGGTPLIFNTITVSDGISMGTEGMRYSLPSREIIADSIETVNGQNTRRKPCQLAFSRSRTNRHTAIVRSAQSNGSACCFAGKSCSRRCGR